MKKGSKFRGASAYRDLTGTSRCPNILSVRLGFQQPCLTHVVRNHRRHQRGSAILYWEGVGAPISGATRAASGRVSLGRVHPRVGPDDTDVRVWRTGAAGRGGESHRKTQRDGNQCTAMKLKFIARKQSSRDDVGGRRAEPPSRDAQGETREGAGRCGDQQEDVRRD